jgi:hypothetical protein
LLTISFRHQLISIKYHLEHVNRKRDPKWSSNDDYTFNYHAFDALEPESDIVTPWLEVYSTAQRDTDIDDECIDLDTSNISLDMLPV